MGKTFEVKIDRFDGGITNDPLDTSENVARMVTNFDSLTNQRRLIPYRSTESGDSSASTSKKQNFCIAKRTGTTYSLYSLGYISGDTKAEVLYKDLTTGAVNDLDDATWATPANNQSSDGTVNMGLFIYYEFMNKIFGLRTSSGNRPVIWIFDPTGGAWTDSERDIGNYRDVPSPITEENICGLVHSKDDILYIGFGANVIKNNNGTWTPFSVAALELPRKYLITAMCEYDGFLAIACAPANGVENSRIYLWDRDSSLTTISESIDAGEGIIKILEEVDGQLVSISLSGANGGTSATRFNDRVSFRRLVGQEMVKIKELQTGGTTAILRNRKQKIDNRLWFMMSISLNGATREGCWSVGRSNTSGQFTVVHEATPNNDTALSSGALNGFIKVGDYLFQSYTSGGTYGLSKTDDSANYTATAIYETTIRNDGDSSLTKKLLGVTVHTESMPAAGQIVLKYRVNRATNWTTIFTNTTDSDISHDAVNIESSGANLGEYKEIEFRIESTGGAVVTGLSYKGELVDRKKY